MSALNNIVTKLEDKSYRDAVNNDTGDDDLRSQIADFLTAHKDNLEKEGTLIQELRNQATSENPAMNGQAILDELKAIRKATKGTKEAVS
jgi:methionine synthase II (cobalamin-independent)